jgi:hypothetical protein
LRVGEWNEGVAFWETVLKDDAGDPLLVEPFGNAVTFRTGHEATVSTAGADHEGCPVRFFGMMDGQGGSSEDWRSRAGRGFTRPERLFGGGNRICRDKCKRDCWKKGEEGSDVHD